MKLSLDGRSKTDALFQHRRLRVNEERHLMHAIGLQAVSTTCLVEANKQGFSSHASYDTHGVLARACIELRLQALCRVLVEMDRGVIA